MNNYKISNADIQKRLIKNLNDRPNASATYGGAKKNATQVKDAFDEQFEFLAGEHNKLVDGIGPIGQYAINESARIAAEEARDEAEGRL